MRELQALCLDVATYKLNIQENVKLQDYEINLMNEGVEQKEFPQVTQNVKMGSGAGNVFRSNENSPIEGV